MRLRARGTRIALLLFLMLLLGVAGHRLVAYRTGRSRSRAAEAALERRDFQQARLLLKQCLEARPDDPAVRLLAAQAARRQGDYDEALQHLRVCEENEGPRAAVGLERQLIRMQRGELAEALPLASWLDRPEAPETPLVIEALVEGSLTALAPVAAGGATSGVHGDRGSPSLAMLRKAVGLWLRLRPGRADQAQGLVWRGRLHRIANEHASALADLRQALEWAPDHFDARFHLALAVAQESPDETASHLEVLRRREPGHKQVLYVLGTVRRLLGQLEEARQLFDELLAGSPDEVPFLLERGLVDLDAGRTDGAERWLRRALARAPEGPEVYLALSRCLRGAGRPEEAKRYLARSRQLEAARERQQREQLPKVAAGE